MSRRVLVKDLSRKQVRGILVEEEEDLGHSLTESVNGPKDPDGTSESTGGV